MAALVERQIWLSGVLRVLEASNRFRSLPAPPKGNKHYIDIRTSPRGVHYSIALLENHRLKVGLYIETPNKSVNAQILQPFLDRRTEIENALGGSVVWSQGFKKRSFFESIRPVTNLNGESQELAAAILLKLESICEPLLFSNRPNLARKKRLTWTQEIVEALQALGGRANYEDLYQYIERHTYRDQLPPQWQAIVRNAIEKHSSDTSCDKPKNFEDLFYAVEGLGNGVWGLRERVPKHYMQYWRPKEVQAELAREAAAEHGLRLAGGTQLEKLGARDTLWIVTVNDDNYLQLCGKLVVDEVISATDVAAHIGRPPAYPSTIYAVAVAGTEVPLMPRDISMIAPSLRFVSDDSPRLVLDGKAVSPYQLQSMRMLTDDSAELMEFAWSQRFAAADLSVANEQFHDSPESDIENKPPQPSESSGKDFDAEARRQAIDRRILSHWELVRDIKNRAIANTLSAKKTRYIDVVTYKEIPTSNAVIFEIKSLERDDADQARRAIGQLFLYRFLHHQKYGDAGLIACVYEEADL